MGLPETAEALKAAWTAFCDALTFPRRCVHCDRLTARPRSRSVRGASVLLGGEVQHLDSFPVRRARCGPCRKSWLVRPPGLTANRHYQLDVVAEAMTAYLYRGDTPSRIAQELGVAVSTVIAWRDQLAGLAEPALLQGLVCEASGEPLLPTLPELAERLGLEQKLAAARRILAERAARVLALLELLATAWGLGSPGLQAVVEHVVGDRTDLFLRRAPAVPGFRWRGPVAPSASLPM